jgi:hypothetical protein
MHNIPVASTAMAWDIPETGETTISMFHQGLWFGDNLTNSLINPNQCQINGIDVCDDPFDTYRSLGVIEPTTDFNVPMEFGRSFVYFQSRAPTMNEICDNPHIEMTSNIPWDPATVGQRCLLREEEEEQRNIVTRIQIDQNISTRPNEPQLPYNEAEYDILLSSCFAVYSDWTLIQHLILSIQVTSSHDKEEDLEDKKDVPQWTVAAVDIQARHTAISAEEISRKFGVGLEIARQTLKATTQYGSRHAVHPLSRRDRTDILQSKRKWLNDTFQADTMFSGIRSLWGNTNAQLFTNGNFVHLEPMERKSQAGEALLSMVNEVGIPDKVIFDGAKEQTGKQSDFMKGIRKYRISNWQTKPYSPWQNCAEDQIQEVKRRWNLLPQQKEVPIRLWYYAMGHISKLKNMMARGPNGRTGHEEIMGNTPDISEFIDFGFYDWVWYWDTPDKENSPKIEQWLGPSHRIGAAMCYYILVSNGKVISRTSVQHVTKLEMMQYEIKQKMEAFNNEVQGPLQNKGFDCRHKMENAFYINNEDVDEVEPEEPTGIDEADTFTPEAYDEYIGAQVMLPYQVGRIQGTITEQSKGNDGNPIDTRRHKIELSDGTTEEYNASVIAKNLFSQVDSDGCQ